MTISNSLINFNRNINEDIERINSICDDSRDIILKLSKMNIPYDMDKDDLLVELIHNIENIRKYFK